MRVALVHDYLNEAGGAERVLRVLADMFPGAPIYTAFAVSGSSAARMFEDRKINTSWFGWIPGFRYLYSPFRFLIPWIWGSFNFSGYDLMISSASWYVTKGLGRKWGVPEICYCHTPPRWLYGYDTSINWQKYWPVRWYGLVVGHFIRQYDFKQAQKVDVFVANSKEVANRIRKFYRREAEVVYPPVSSIPYPQPLSLVQERGDYFLMVTRVVGGKGIELALEAAKEAGFKLKIAGEKAGFSNIQFPDNVEFLGRVNEEEKFQLMMGAKAFLALSRDEDFGIAPVEAQMCGTPVIAFNGGGYKESVVDGKTGVLFDDYSAEGLLAALERFNKLKWNREYIRKNVDNFSEMNFREKMSKMVGEALRR